MMAAQTERSNAKLSHRENTKITQQQLQKKKNDNDAMISRVIWCYLKGKTLFLFFCESIVNSAIRYWPWNTFYFS